MPYRLPPLNSLRLFEAAGRHLSFKLAAEELGITPSAVSHGIKSLEDWLGVALFSRDNRGLSLTDAGAAYMPRVRQALDLLAAATDAVPRRRLTPHVSVSVAPGFGVRWLIPNLPCFSERHPDIEVSVDTSHRQIDFPRDGVDLAIRMGRGDWPDVDAVRLVEEELVPVCAPSIAQTIGSAMDLAGQTLLHITSVSEDWAAWSQLAGVADLKLDQGLRFDSVDMAFEAAAEGLGIAIGRLPLVATDLAAGRLVSVLGPPRRGQTGYWLATGGQAPARPEVVLFRNWICTALTETAPKTPVHRPT